MTDSTSHVALGVVMRAREGHLEVLLEAPVQLIGVGEAREEIVQL